MLHKIRTGTKFRIHVSIGEKSGKIRGRLNSENVTIPNDKITGVIIFA